MGIEHKQLRALLSAFKKSGFAQLDIEDSRISLKLRQAPGASRSTSVPPPAPRIEESGPAPVSAPAPENVITSKRVGHFFPLRDPKGDLAFGTGDEIDEGATIGMIESMNLRYEVKADRSGLFERYLIDEGDPVEYGQPLVELQ